MPSRSEPALANREAVSGAARQCNPCQVCPVREMSVCGALEPREVERLNAIVTRVRVGAEQAVFYEGDPAEFVFNVTGGTVRLSKMLPDGRRQITGFLHVGDFLGIAYSDTYAYTAEALTPVSLCRFPQQKLESLFEEFPGLEKRVLGVASNELRAAQDQMLLLGRKSAGEKLSTFLLRLSQQEQQRGGSNGVIDLPMNRTDIADYLGLTTETVSRIFSRMAKDGILELPTTHRVILQQPERLQALAEGE